jgi:hypothetical protein
MKKFLPYILVFASLVVGVAYFMYQYSPGTLEKKESDFAIPNINDVTRVRLTDVKGNIVELTLKDKKWIVNGKYEVNEAARNLLFTCLQKLETNYRAPANAEKNILKDMAGQRTKCEIYLNNETEAAKVYYVGGPTADGEGTYMIMERNGQMARHTYITHIPGINAYLTGRYYPMEERWRSVWIFRENDQTIESLKVTYNLELQKSFILTKAAKDSFVIANSEGQVTEQPKQKFIHQYLNFYDGLSLEQFENKNPAKDTILPNQPFCTITIRRADKTQSSVNLYYIPVSDQTRVEFDEQGRKLLFDIEHYYISFNDNKDFALIQYYTWGKVLHSYQDFFTKPK